MTFWAVCVQNKSLNLKKKLSEINSSPTEVTAQVEAAASDWRFVASQAESGKSHDFQSQLATSQVAATLNASVEWGFAGESS